MKLKTLVGSGEKIGLLTLPFLFIIVILHFTYPSLLRIEGTPPALKLVSIIMLTVGVITWVWSAVLILIKVPRHELITSGPYTLVKHPLYTGVALLVLPWLGFLFDSYIGLLIGMIVYVSSRIYAPEEEKILSKSFGAKWEQYSKKVAFPWL